jgi:hypothetical protein
MIIIFFEKCNDKTLGENIIKIDGKNFNLIKFKSDTLEVYNTTSVTKKGDDIYRETYRKDTLIIINEVDTALILRDFFVKNVYKDTLELNDDLGFVFLIDTITKNTLTDRKWTTYIKQKNIQDVKTVEEVKKKEYFIGMNANLDGVNYLNSVGTGIMMKDKKDKIYQLNVGLSTNQPNTSTSQFRPYIGGGMFWKIK